MENSLFQSVKATLSHRMEEVVSDLLPGGKVSGHEYVCGSLAGGVGESCKTNLITGIGSDFATGEKWGDIIDLAAQAWRASAHDAAKRLANHYGVITSPSRPVQAGRRTAYIPVMPIPDSAQPPLSHHPLHGAASASWCYRNAEGKPLFHILRFDDARKGKIVLPLCLCRDGQGHLSWRWTAPLAPRPLYGLEHLAKTGSSTAVLLVEGEKTADAAQRLFPEYVCMTWSGGANAAGKSDFSPLAGRSVVVWPDNDEPGIKAAVELFGLLIKCQVKDVKIVYPPNNLPDKWDMADPMPDGFDVREQLAKVMSRDDFLHAVRYRHGENGLGVIALELLADAEDEFDIPTWPVLSHDALPGFAGEFVDLATRDSEADPAAVLATLLVRFGAEVYAYQKDKGPYLAIGEAVHPPRLFAVVCGNSSKARKGTSRQPITRLFKRDLCDPEELAGLNLPPAARESGGPLSTGEGLAYPLRDNAQDDGCGRDIGDKRLCIMDEELASGLSCTKREGNTLSMAIRTFWDGGDYSPLTKTNPMQVRGAHICLLSHITKTELDLSLSSVNMANGFGNRFL